LKIAVPKETKPYEKRVALTPDIVKSLLKAGWTCIIEEDAGISSSQPHKKVCRPPNNMIHWRGRQTLAGAVPGIVRLRSLALRAMVL